MSAEVTSNPVPGQRYKFVVGSADEAAKVIRERLGEAAQVISVRQVEGKGLARFLSSPRLEVIAEMPLPKPAPVKKVEEPQPNPPAAVPVHREVIAEQPLPRASATSSTIPSPKPRVSDLKSEPNRLWTLLGRAGLPNEFIARISHRPEWKELAAQPLHTAMAKSIALLRIALPRTSQTLTQRVAFFGTPGVGSTTALCKQLASDIFIHRKSACVVKLDTDEPNSTEGLAMFCEALGAPLLRTEKEIDNVGDETNVYFDVPGSTISNATIELLGAIFDRFRIESRVLVVNAAYDRELIQDTYSNALKLRGTHVVFTHLDELNRHGKLWEFALDGGLVPLFASTGQNIAGDCDRNLIDLLIQRTLSAS